MYLSGEYQDSDGSTTGWNYNDVCDQSLSKKIGEMVEENVQKQYGAEVSGDLLSDRVTVSYAGDCD